MNYKKVKRIILVLLAIMLTAFCSVTLISAISFDKQNPPQKEIEAATIGFKDDGTALTYDEYTSQTNFRISSLNQFLSFKNTVEDGWDYAGRTVTLYCDIDLTNTAWTPIGITGRTFKGAFNGFGNTITGAGQKQGEVNYTTGNYGALFVELGGEEKDIGGNLSGPTHFKPYVAYLKLINFKQVGIQNNGSCGALAYNVTTDEDENLSNISLDIYQVSVSNYTCEVSDSNFRTGIGGLIGDIWLDGRQNIEIYDCEVSGLNFELTSYTAPTSRHFSGIAGIIRGNTTSGCSIKHCVVQCGEGDITCKSFDGNDLATINRFKHFAQYEEDYNTVVDATDVLIVENCWSAPNASIDNFSDWDNVSTVYNTNYVWFIDSTFNKGYPTFMDFLGTKTTFYFYFTENKKTEKHGYVKDNSGFASLYSYGGYLYISQPSSITISKADAKIKIGDKEFEAVEDTGYKFSGWTEETTGTTKEYTANFEPEQYILTFTDASGTSGDSIRPSTPNSFTVNYGTGITVTPTDAERKSGEFDLTYSFTNSSGTACSVTYTITDKYTLTSADNPGTITGATTITPEVEINTFTLTFTDASGTSGDTISPSTPNSFIVKYDTSITITPTNAEGKSGPFDLIYSFTDSSGTACSVNYTITNKYKLTSANNPGTITGATTITPAVELNAFTLTFTNASGTSGDTISPSTPNSFIVKYDTSITITPTNAEGKSGPFDLIYSFTDSSGTARTVTYNITAKYTLTSADNPGTITGAITITPAVVINKFNIDFGGINGSWGSWTSVGVSAASSGGVSYGTEIGYAVAETKVTLTMNGQQKVFTANANHKIDYLEITTASGKNSYTPGASGTITVTGSVSFYVSATRWYKVTFEPAKDENGNASNNATLTAAINPIEVKDGDTISVTGNESKTLTYSYGKESVTYQANKFYRLLGTSITPTEDIKITPTVDFWACEVTFGDIDSNIGTREVKNDTWGDTEEELKDGIFAVEFDTEVSFKIENTTTPGLFKYVYTFSSGEVVTYTITNNQYAMEYILDAEGNRTGIKNGLKETIPTDSFTFEEGEESKTITPTFSLKQIWGGLA